MAPNDGTTERRKKRLGQHGVRIFFYDRKLYSRVLVTPRVQSTGICTDRIKRRAEYRVTYFFSTRNDIANTRTGEGPTGCLLTILNVLVLGNVTPELIEQENKKEEVKRKKNPRVWFSRIGHLITNYLSRRRVYSICVSSRESNILFQIRDNCHRETAMQILGLF